MSELLRWTRRQAAGRRSIIDCQAGPDNPDKHRLAERTIGAMRE